ncbi:glucokinase [Acuticoccus mangrovi]|uniref:Glucokinase n=1 Tax=Acuticoccus mangrovi TaxID=2796142 RepID=A0A934IR61_9HYPH|nr:glucokinase [Acuticoccus mangrovi]MBJ3776550.1 glucokinase [Acuticoccus mangrovi]
MTFPPRRRRGDIHPIPFPVLIADIGGTNVRLGVLTEAHSPLRIFPTKPTHAFPDFVSAATEIVLDTTSVLPRSLLIALAGPVGGESVKLTNADWVIEPTRLAEALDLETVIMFNDFEALALSLPALEGEQLMQIGGGEAMSREPRVVIGPGTGLGVAALVYADQCYTPIAGEGGHVSFGPESPRDFEIWPHLERFHGRISGEALMSGDGLMRIYHALSRLAGIDASWCEKGADVTGAAANGDQMAEEAIDLFLTYLGRLAGDLALIFLARGGVYIAGGVAPRVKDRFATSGFRAAFESKAPHEAIMASIPSFLITEPKPAMAGMATFATMPERFSFDLKDRRFDR